MSVKRFLLPVVANGSVLVFTNLATVGTGDPLPSWNDGQAKQSIVAFVARVTKADSPDFVPPAERIAVFDYDGTLWSEQPMYFQVLFALDRVKALAPRHPEWKDEEPFASLLKGDVKGALEDGMKSVVEIIMATHAGNRIDDQPNGPHTHFVEFPAIPAKPNLNHCPDEGPADF
jgi:hypothetical protein